MPDAGPPTATQTRPRPVLPLAIWLGGGLMLVAIAWLAVASGRTVELALSLVIVPAAFLTSGLIAWRRRPERRLGALLMLVAAPYALAVPRLLVPELAILGAFILPASDVAQAYVLTAFPGDRIHGRLERAGMAILVVAFAAYVILTAITLEPAIHVPAGCPPCGPNPFRLIDDRDAAAVVQSAFAVVLVLAVLLIIIIIIRRWFVATGPARRVLTPVLFGGIVFTAGLAARQVMGLLADTAIVPVVDIGTAIIRALVPIGLVAAFLRLESARDAVVGTAVQVGAGLSAAGLEGALRRALHDPDLTVAVWSDAATSYLDQEGRHVAPRDDGRQVARRLERDGHPLAVVLHDPAIDDPALVDAIEAAVRLAVDASRMRDRLEARGRDVASLPRGDVSFLFGDIEGSTELLARIGDRYVDVLETLRGLVRAVAAARHGQVVDVRADECFLAFGRPADAVAAAVDLQRRIGAARPADERFRFRIGLHRGRPDVLDDSYVGLDVHLAARVMATANGGQIVVSRAIVDAVDHDVGVEFHELGAFRLKGIPEPVDLAWIIAPGLEPDARPIRADPVSEASVGRPS